MSIRTHQRRKTITYKRPRRAGVLLPPEARRASKYLWKGEPREQEWTWKISQKHQPQRSTDMWANHSQRLPVTQRFLNTTILLPSPLARAPAANSSCYPHSPGPGKCYGVQLGTWPHPDRSLKLQSCKTVPAAKEVPSRVKPQKFSNKAASTQDTWFWSKVAFDCGMGVGSLDFNQVQIYTLSWNPQLFMLRMNIKLSAPPNTSPLIINWQFFEILHPQENFKWVWEKKIWEDWIHATACFSLSSKSWEEGKLRESPRNERRQSPRAERVLSVLEMTENFR